ncbi:hypothetical protein Acr_01g0007520 [Actinidia rufa]|uniref:Transposase MuDR plant domain-containing protein n=1 Tax=Actinidia rufa TaxID=165716 RepID=A0A7J0E339_9ERIC|nr:hypothetical protein Acr_01g0007520 [Actinidia rufa]
MFEFKEEEKIDLEKGMLVKNEKSRVTEHCGSHDCSWRIHASPLPDCVTYKIKFLGPDHTCVIVERNSEATSTWIAKKFLKALRGNPMMSLEAMHDDLIEKAYFKHIYLKAYGDIIHPLQDQSMWDEVPGEPVQSPPLGRMPSRPKKIRRREADEAAPGPSDSRRSCTVRCGNYKGFGHNKRTSQRAPVRGSSRGIASSGKGNGEGSESGSVAKRGRGRALNSTVQGSRDLPSQGTGNGRDSRGRDSSVSGRSTNGGVVHLEAGEDQQMGEVHLEVQLWLFGFSSVPSEIA